MTHLSPQAVKTVLFSDPDDRPGGEAMQFRLTYEGPLWGASRSNTRADHKHEIRRVFHKQLRRLWETNPVLRNRQEWLASDKLLAPNMRPKMYLWEYLAHQYARNGYNFVPLVTERLSLLCRLDILFLRPDPPGSLVQSGDLDNRIKTLFDALRIPASAEELGSHTLPADDEKPFFCLLEDDKLITHIAVETDILLRPVGREDTRNDARLVLSITVRPANVHVNNLDFV